MLHALCFVRSCPHCTDILAAAPGRRAKAKAVAAAQAAADPEADEFGGGPADNKAKAEGLEGSDDGEEEGSSGKEHKVEKKEEEEEENEQEEQQGATAIPGKRVVPLYRIQVRGNSVCSTYSKQLLERKFAGHSPQICFCCLAQVLGVEGVVRVPRGVAAGGGGSHTPYYLRVTST